MGNVGDGGAANPKRFDTCGRTPSTGPLSRFRPAAICLTVLLSCAVVVTTATTPVAAAPTTAAPTSAGASASPLDGLHFSNITKAAGLASPETIPGNSPDPLSAGVAACDLFGNGLIDFYVTRIGLPNELFRNNGNGTFTNVAKSAGVQGTDWQQGYSGATCGDLNGDGRPDLYVMGDGTAGNILYLNDGHGRFSDVTKAAGLAFPPLSGSTPGLMYGTAFGDYNHDGHLDIVTLQWDETIVRSWGSGSSLTPTNLYGGLHLAGGPCVAAGQRLAIGAPTINTSRSALYRNDGNRRGGIPHFSNVTKAMGLNFDQVLGFTPTFVDLTGNGWDDLVISGDGCTSQVYLNHGGKEFVNVTPRSGADTAENGMGSVFADFSGSGLPDWFETSIADPGTCPTANTFSGCSGNRLYRNAGNGSFTDATDEYGVRNGGWGWGATAQDFNNTGHLSIAQVDGFLGSSSLLVNSSANPLYSYYLQMSRGSPYLWLNSGTPPFDQVAAQVGLISTGQEKAVVPIDVRHNGKVGLLITNSGGDPVLFENDTTNGNGWVTITLRDNRSANRFGVGAQVRILATADGAPQQQELLDGGSYDSSDPLQLHFGFGPGVQRVAAIEVFWPGQSHPQVLRNVTVDRYLQITRR